MNKTEKLISILLGLALAWCFMSGVGRKPAEEATPAETTEAAATNAVEQVAAETNAAPVTAVAEQVAAVTNAVPAPAPVEIPVLPAAVLENDELRLEFSPVGGVLTKATLKKFATNVGEIAEDNPAVDMVFTEPLGRLTGVPGVNEATVFTVTTNEDATALAFAAGGVTRTYTLGADYTLTLEEKFAAESRPAGANGLSVGSVARGAGEHDLVSVDSRLGDASGTIVHHDDDDSPLKALLTGAAAGGCGACGAANVGPETPVFASQELPGSISWLALKNRFFVAALTKTSQANTGFGSTVWRDLTSAVYRADAVSATVNFAEGAETRTSEFFIGPKQQALLWNKGDAGMKDVMEFGWWRWICYPTMWLLNFFYGFIPNYGVAIILLTILVRLVFWPLTRKSTEGMKKMQEIQPKLKELQAKFKDNPQRLQQETFALYREKKVNPLSSCLPMLIQIPVFFALYKVLGASVELRHAGFLWIADLSEPEHLFAAWFPFGGLNILPILMAVTMYLQSKLTPSAGDPAQQRMMTIFMPIMMLWMFYNFAAALSLYWTLSQVMSIIQMWLIRRQAEQKRRVFEPEIIDPPTPTRQQRRHE